MAGSQINSYNAYNLYGRNQYNSVPAGYNQYAQSNPNMFAYANPQMQDTVAFGNSEVSVAPAVIPEKKGNKKAWLIAGGIALAAAGIFLTKGKLWGKAKAFDNKTSKIYEDAMINNVKNVYEEFFSNQAKIAKEKFGIDMAKPKFSVSHITERTVGGCFSTESGDIAMKYELFKKDSHIMLNGEIRNVSESGMQHVLEKLNDKEITKAGKFELRKITQEEHQEYITGMISHELEHAMQLDLIRRMPDFETKYLNGMKKVRPKDFEGLSDIKILEKLKQEDAFMFKEGVAKINSSKMIVTDEEITLNGKTHHIKYTVEDLFNALVNYSSATTTVTGKNVYLANALEIGANLRGYNVMQKKFAQSNIQKDAKEVILKMYTDYLSNGLNLYSK